MCSKIAAVRAGSRAAHPRQFSSTTASTNSLATRAINFAEVCIMVKGRVLPARVALVASSCLRSRDTICDRHPQSHRARASKLPAPRGPGECALPCGDRRRLDQLPVEAESPRPRDPPANAAGRKLRKHRTTTPQIRHCPLAPAATHRNTMSALPQGAPSSAWRGTAPTSAAARPSSSIIAPPHGRSEPLLALARPSRRPRPPRGHRHRPSATRHRLPPTPHRASTSTCACTCVYKHRNVHVQHVCTNEYIHKCTSLNLKTCCAFCFIVSNCSFVSRFHVSPSDKLHNWKRKRNVSWKRKHTCWPRTWKCKTKGQLEALRTRWPRT